MIIPKTVNSAILAALASPAETHCVRVIVRRVQNTFTYTLRGKDRAYMAAYDKAVAAHVIDIPLSVWMDGIPAGNYRDNHSIAHDLQAARAPSLAPLVFMILPWTGTSATPPVEKTATNPIQDYLAPLEDLIRSYNPPAPLLEALTLAREGHAEALRLYVGGILQDRKEAAKEADPVVDMEQPPETDTASVLDPETGIGTATGTAPPPAPKPRKETAAERMARIRAARKAAKQLATA